MRKPQLRRLQRTFPRYAASLGIVSGAFLLWEFLVKTLGIRPPAFITFYPAVMLVALVAGFWPGIVAVVLCAALSALAMLSPDEAGAVSPSHVVSIVFFFGTGIAMCLVAERYRRGQSMLVVYDERVRAEQMAVRRGEGQLRLFVEHAPVALAIFDREMRYLFASRRWRDDQGLGPGDLRGQSHYELSIEIPERWREVQRRCLAGEVVKSERDLLQRPDGTSQCVRWEVHPWREPDGSVGGIVILGEDITERLHSELQIERLNRIQSVLSGINQTIVRVRDSPAMLSAACSIAIDKGKFRMAWVGMLDDAGEEVNPITHCGEVDGYLDRLRIRVRGDNVAIGPAGRCILTGEHTVSNDIETDSIFAPWREDALHRGYRSMAVFPLILHGKTVGVFALYSSEPHFFDEEETKLLDQLAMDVSFALEVNEDDLKRQKVEEELRWSTAFFQAQLESSFDGILVKDETGRVLYRNERFLQLWGLPEDAANETDGGKLFQLMVQMGKDPGRLTRDTDRLTARRDEVSETEIELLDGTILNRLTSPVKDASGRYYGRIWVYHDMTKRRRLEHQLRQSQKMVALGQLTGGIAHDFNNLLAIILGNIDLMKPMLAENEPALHRLGILEKAAERGADMTRRLLAFSSNLELKPAPTRLADSVHNVIELARSVGPDIRFAPCLDESIPPIMVDAPGLENAMLNLVVNGRDAMPNGGTLTIATGLRSLEDDFPLVQAGDLKAQTYACISVSDTGCGMPKETVERAFEPFFTTKAQDRGTGLGLSMVYGFVKQSGGAVRIESEVGFGTTVSIFLPLGNAVPQPAAAVETTSDLAEKRTVLVVDDEPELVAILMTHLTRLGYRAFQAENGASALAIAQERTDLDLIITDIIMPGGMNGVELAVKVRELHPNIRVVYSSGYPADAMADRGLTPIDGIVLGKPYRAREFEKAIRESLA